MGKSRVGLIIPAYNEEKTIGNVVNGVSQYGQAIVVDDASTDKTASIASTYGAIVVKHSANLGYESAIESGFRIAYEMGIKIVVTLDADGQHNPKMVKKFIASIRSGNDLALGVRDKFPRISETLFSLYSYNKFGIKDPMCGMKAYKIDLYKKVGYFDSCKLVGSELAFRLVSDGNKFEQIPFLIESRHGKSKYGGAFLANVRIMRALLLTFFKYK
jgi:glycosyltransferase involved in cell wall biosynthesis